MTKQTAPDDLVLRPLASAEDYAACVELQEATWGRGFADRVPPSLLMITQKVGGIAAGAFEPDGTLAGFVLGFTGIRAGRPAHWSHMLAVREDRRDRGIGRWLKRYQRDQLLESGVDRMYWTFDPLVARNAQLNLNELGATIEEYVPDFYGPGEDSPVDRGIGTDRFVVRWDVGRETARDGRTETDGGGRADVESGNVVHVEIPPDIHALKTAAPAEAAAWRNSTRAAFMHYLGRGYRVVGFKQDLGGRGGSYLLAQPWRARSSVHV